MLETVKQFIADLPDDDFPTYYQHYVMETQDELLDREVKKFSSSVKSINQINEVEAALIKLQNEVHI